VRRRAAVVEQQIDPDRQQHPAERPAGRNHHGARVLQFPGFGLPADLQPEDEEEDRHRRVVHEMPQVEGDPVLADGGSDGRLPE
jgi:hypothetical protein